MPAPANLVHQLTTGTGTGNLTLTTTGTGKQTFDQAFSHGVTTNVFDYFISHQTASEWERGTGHMSDATTLVRDTVIESSNANAAVSFSAGTKDVINDVPAAKQATTDTAQTLSSKILSGTYTGKVWNSETPAAQISRIDRLLIGGATVNSGDLPTTTKDWLETLIASTTSLSQTAALSPEGLIGVLGGSRASDASASGQGTMGLAGFVQNNLASNSAYGGYFEAWTNTSATNAAATHGVEIDIVNKSGGTPTLTPYSLVQTNLSAALWLASGGGKTGTTAASVAIGILDNTATFNKGIIFNSTALVTSVGAGGNGVAIEMARNQTIRWLNSGGTTDAEIWGNASGINLPKAVIVGSGTTGNNGLNISATQTQPNSSDTNDSALALGFTLSASSATNELVTRVMKFDSVNSLTGGGHLQFMRLMEMNPNISSGAATDTLEYVYLSPTTGAGAANVTTSIGVHIPAGWGATNNWGIKDESNTNWLMKGSFATKTPVTLTGTSGSVGQYDSSIIVNASGTFTLTLPSASTYTGRWMQVKTIAAQAVNSASSNVVPIGSATAGTAILTNTAGKWAILQSDGTNWIVMAAN